MVCLGTMLSKIRATILWTDGIIVNYNFTLSFPFSIHMGQLCGIQVGEEFCQCANRLGKDVGFPTRCPCLVDDRAASTTHYYNC